MSKKSAKAELPEGELLRLAQRLDAVVAACGSKVKAAEVAQVTPEQIRRMVTGESVPGTLTVVRLAKATGYSLDWILTGEGPERRGLHRLEEGLLRLSEGKATELLAGSRRMRKQYAVIEALEPALEEVHGPMSEADASDVVGTAWDRIDETGLPVERWLPLVPFVVVTHWAAVNGVKEAQLRELMSAAFRDAITFTRKRKG